MILRQALLEEELLRNEIYAKRVIAEARTSPTPQTYIPVLEGIQLEVNSLLSEIKKYE